MRVSFIDGYSIPLPKGHAFPMDKFSGLHHILREEGLISPADITNPEPASWEMLGIIHTEDYLHKLETQTLSRQEERMLGLPLSDDLVMRARLSVQGTVNVAAMALEDGIAANLAGGTHHAFPDHGEGFCMFNDVATAIRVHQQTGRIKRALIFDLDVHHGNGNAFIFADDPDVTTFSMHGEKNYPRLRPPSSRDVDLPDGMEDEEYLELLEAHIGQVFDEAQADIVFYLGGVDPMVGDRFGRLALTREGLHRRERRVLKETHRRGVPITLLLAGGYAKSPMLTADLHAIAHREARRVYG